MEEPSKHFDQTTAKWVKEAGLEKPSFDFTTQVMQKVAAKNITVAPKSLIPRWGWLVIAAFFVGAIVLLYGNQPSQPGLIEGYLADKSLAIENPFKGMAIPKTFFYGVGFLALFLLQIPFLKKQINKNYIQ